MDEGLFPFKGGGETHLTHRLKWLAWEWLYNAAQCRSIGMEVRSEGPGGRVADLLAVGPKNVIYVVEVKSSRADFARDNHTSADYAALQSRAASLERRTSVAQETLAQCRAYAKETQRDGWEGIGCYVQAVSDVQRLARERTAYEARLGAYSIKFHDRRFLNIADYHYIMAPRGIIPQHKVPPQWGLLDDTPGVVVQAPVKDVRKTTGIVSNILRAIARSNATAMMRAQGARFSEDGVEFPKPSLAKETAS
jgi:hypothetical protein